MGVTTDSDTGTCGWSSPFPQAERWAGARGTDSAVPADHALSSGPPSHPHLGTKVPPGPVRRREVQVAHKHPLCLERQVSTIQPTTTYP